MLRTAPTASPAKAVPPSADLMAHRQGSVLILSERLGALASAFDRLRSLRYKQLQQEEANRRRRTPLAQPGGGDSASGSNYKINSRTAAALAGVGKSVGNQLRAAFDSTTANMMDNGNGEDAGAAFMRPSAPGRGLPSEQQQQQMQRQVDAENLALQAELLSMSDQVQTTEKTVREIATLNQMFSTAILHQSEQIEKLFQEAVAATTTLGRANVQLDKAVKTNKSAQKCMFILLVMASVILLFLDWWYS
jgi:syntaxin 18